MSTKLASPFRDIFVKVFGSLTVLVSIAYDFWRESNKDRLLPKVEKGQPYIQPLIADR
jgi:hypothetical protein